MIFRDKTSAAVCVGGVAIIAAGFFMPPWLIDHFLSSLSRGLAVLGLMVLWRTGLISFGHGLYFGVGAYAVAFLYRNLDITDIFLRLGAGVLAATLLGWALGFILRRYRGIFFAMLSLAFSMVLYAVLVRSSIFGSTDGFTVPPPTFFGHSADLAGTRTMLLVVFSTFAVVAALAVHMYLQSTMGRLCTAIRDNEIRVDYLGFSVPAAVHAKYVISAALAGAGGSFMATVIGQVDPDSMINWTLSGELVFVAIFSGAGSVLAPFLGSVLFDLLRSNALLFAPHAWHFIMGATLLFIILVLPEGLWSLGASVRAAVARVFRRPARTAMGEQAK